MFTSFEKKKKRIEEMLSYWSSLVRMAGSYEKERERENIYPLDIHLKRRKIYI
jgi:hypothetical protein